MFEEESVYHNEYEKWLIDKVDPEHEYTTLLDILHNKVFYSSIPMDENRANDGKWLRQEFENYCQDDILRIVQADLFYDIPASVLEVVVALAGRMDLELCDTYEDEDRTDVYFWKLMQNLGLVIYKDRWVKYDMFDPEADSKSITEDIMGIVDKFCSREYNASGLGGLFPLRNPHCDQREVELWNQMNSYMLENY